MTAHAREQEHLECLERSVRDVVRQLRLSETDGRLDLELIKLTYDFLETLRARVAEQSRLVADLAGQAEAKREELIRTMQERKVLEKLKEKFLAELDEQAGREEMRLNDEIARSLHHRATRDPVAVEGDVDA